MEKYEYSEKNENDSAVSLDDNGSDDRYKNYEAEAE